MLEKVQILDYIGAVVIYADEDKSFTGQAAAYVLAHRLKRKGKAVYVSRTLGFKGQPAFNSGAGIDYSDLLKQP